MKKTMSLLAAAVSLLGAGYASAYTAPSSSIVIVSSDITTDTTWTNANQYVLSGPIYVRNGATLTIGAGTIVRGQPRNNTSNAKPGSLLVTRNGRIEATGSATDPIVFTTAAIDANNDNAADGNATNKNFVRYSTSYTSADFLDVNPAAAPLSPLDSNNTPNLSLWGGVVVLGNAPTNLGDHDGIGYGQGLIEGIDPSNGYCAFGGFNPNDDSGTLKYVSIRHGGDEIETDNEINGLTLAGVGSCTVIDYVEVYCNFDDGIEVFGGTVNLKHCSVFFAGDDQFDFDEGYTGKCQFLLAVMPNLGSSFGSKGGDKACEWDGDDYVEYTDTRDVSVNLDGRPTPFSYPYVFNMTTVGVNNKGAINMRHGFNGCLANSIVVNSGSSAPLKVDASGTTGFDCSDNFTAGTLSICATSFADYTGTLGTTAQAIIDADSSNFDALSHTALHLVEEDYDSTLNPRPAGTSANYLNTVEEPGCSFFDDVSYRGAFAPNAATLWTKDWTAANKIQYLAN